MAHCLHPFILFKFQQVIQWFAWVDSIWLESGGWRMEVDWNFACNTTFCEMCSFLPHTLKDALTFTHTEKGRQKCGRCKKKVPVWRLCQRCAFLPRFSCLPKCLHLTQPSLTRYWSGPGWSRASITTTCFSTSTSPSLRKLTENCFILLLFPLTS